MKIHFDDRLVEEAPDHAKLLAEAWPHGLPDQEKAFLASLRPDRRAELFRRLRAISAAESGDAALGALAEELDLQRVAFFRLRKRWEDEHSLKVLVPYATRERRPSAPPGKVRTARRAAAAGLEMAEAAARVADGDLSLPTARRLVRQARRAEALSPARLRAEFGRRFAVDATAVDLPVPGTHGPEWLACAVMLERASGLVLSTSTSTLYDAPSVPSLLATAAETARRLAIAAREPALEVVMPPPAGPDFQAWATIRMTLARGLGEDRVRFEGDHRFGAAVLDAVGDRIGRIRLRPRATASHRGQDAKAFAGRSVMSYEDAALALDLAIRAHNAPVEERLARLGLIGRGNDPRPLIDLFERLLRNSSASAG